MCFNRLDEVSGFVLICYLVIIFLSNYLLLRLLALKEVASDFAEYAILFLKMVF